MAVSRSSGRRAAPLALAALLAAAPATAQELQYEASFPNAAHHEAEITLSVSGLPRRPVQFQMSRSSAGRYALHEFAKNVYAVRATDERGNPLAVTRADPYSWTVAGHTGTVRFSYTLYADRADGTYSQVDASHAHLNMPATFAWIRGLESWPMAVTFRVPANSRWKAATQLYPTADPFRFTAPNLQYFMDSPVELSDYVVREWPVTTIAGTFPVRVALHHQGSDADFEAYVAMIQKVVQQAIAVFGTTPRFDVGKYTFLLDYLPWASGDGMEHRNSTVISSSRALDGNAQALIGTVSHEFFHAWNVKRIRPRSLEPFDFTRVNMSGELWFAEGFTSYYGPLLLRRAGLVTAADYARRLAFPINAVLFDPGRRYGSPVEMSQRAAFVDAATSIDPTNEDNTFISYYTWGSALGLALDLSLRQKPGRTLDGYMRMLWTKYGQPEVPYTLDDLQATLADYARDQAFADDFFTKYVRGREAPDFAGLLAQAGLLLRPRNPGTAWLGPARFEYDSSGARLTAPTQVGTPLYEAGLDVGDQLVTVDGTPIRSDADWQAVKARHQVGDVVEARYRGRGAEGMTHLTFAADPRLEVVTYEEAGRPVSDAINTFRQDWVGARN